MLDYIVLDIEATKIPNFKPWHDGAYLCSVCIETPDKSSKVWFFNPLLGDELNHLKEIKELVGSAKELVGHNIKYDLLWFQEYGIDFSHCTLYDTMIADYLLHGQKDVGYKLNDVARRRHLGEKVDEMAVWWDNGFETDEIPVDLHEEYVKQDVNLTHQIYLEQKKDLDKYGLRAVADLTFAMSKVLTEVEYAGAPFDATRAVDFCNKAEELVKEHEATMKVLAGVDFEPSSSQQLSAVMFGGEWTVDGVEEYTVTLKSGVEKVKTRKCKLPVTYPGLGFVCSERDVSKKTGKPSTSSQVVDTLPAKTKKQREFLNAVKSARKLHKTISSIRGKKGDKGWLASLTSDGRLHGDFNQTVTATGRLSSSNPNLQNLPRSKGTDFPLKQIFKPEDGKLILNVDLKQIEWRVAAELSRDAVMIDELNRGVDIHTENAKAIFGADPGKMSAEEFSVIRTASKTVSFRLLYGGSAYGFYFDSRMPQYSLKRWKEIVESFYEKYQGLKKWWDRNETLARMQGYIRTPSGRVITLPKIIDGDERSEAHWQHAVRNYPVQSFSADLYNLAVVTIVNRIKKLGLNAQLILLVHDSCVFEVTADDAQSLAKEGLDVFSSIKDFCKAQFGYDIVVPLGGDCEIGLDYGSLRGTSVETISKDIEELTRVA